jgi:uncharacterized repeat protein (TIGR04052 family)
MNIQPVAAGSHRCGPQNDKSQRSTLSRQIDRASLLALGAVCASLLAACGGGSSGGAAPTTSRAGLVADGYLAGAKVCLDRNSNLVCDPTEPSATTATGGAFTISGITQGEENAFPLVVEVPATAVDADNPGVPVGRSFVLSAPAGAGSFVSPLTSLVHREMLADPTKTATAAAADVKTETSLPAGVDLSLDYIARKAANADYDTTHKAAQVIANSLKANHDQIVGEVETADRKELQKQLLQVAKLALKTQGATPDPTKAIGIEDRNELRALIAARTASQAAATQAVEIHFDLVQGTTPVRACDAITVANVAWTNAAPFAALDPLVPQDTAGKLVDTRFYIANVMLIDAAGKATPVFMTENANQSRNVALLDFGFDAAPADGVGCSTTYNMSIVGNVKPGTYTGISMTLGVPIRTADLATKLNHSSVAATETPDVLKSTAMNWAWQDGRKFTKIEFRNDLAPNFQWNLHLGSRNCSAHPLTPEAESTCLNGNRLSLGFASFDAATQKIALDIAPVFAGADITANHGSSPGCMAFPADADCAPIYKAFGIGLTGPNAGRTLSGADAQSVFKVLPR